MTVHCEGECAVLEQLGERYEFETELTRRGISRARTPIAGSLVPTCQRSAGRCSVRAASVRFARAESKCGY